MINKKFFKKSNPSCFNSCDCAKAFRSWNYALAASICESHAASLGHAWSAEQPCYHEGGLTGCLADGVSQMGVSEILFIK